MKKMEKRQPNKALQRQYMQKRIKRDQFKYNSWCWYNFPHFSLGSIFWISSCQMHRDEKKYKQHWFESNWTWRKTIFTRFRFLNGFRVRFKPFYLVCMLYSRITLNFHFVRFDKSMFPVKLCTATFSIRFWGFLGNSQTKP